MSTEQPAPEAALPAEDTGEKIATAGVEPAGIEPAAAEPKQVELPDWLLEAQEALPEYPGEPAVVEPAAPVEPAAETATGLPDWLLEAAPVEF